jgi:ferrous iron transport protein B
MAILTGLMLKHTIMRGEASPFVMELPVYHVPHLKSLVIQTWQRLKGFVLRAGKVIVIVSIFLSALNSFTLSGQAADNINDSALASVSRVITPVFKPIGVHEDNWQATVGLFTGAMAKEVVVGTLNTLYTAENIQEQEFNPAEFPRATNCWRRRRNLAEPERHLQPERAGEPNRSQQRRWRNGDRCNGRDEREIWQRIAAYSYLIFVLLYIPCISVMGAISRESSRGWMGFSICGG